MASPLVGASFLLRPAVCSRGRTCGARNAPHPYDGASLYHVVLLIITSCLNCLQALGGTPLWAHALIATAFALCMTLPFTMVVSPRHHIFDAIQRYCKGSRPLDAALWAPYARQTSQDELYIIT